MEISNEILYQQYMDKGYCILPGYINRSFIEVIENDINKIEDCDKYYDNTGLIRRIERIYDKTNNLLQLDGLFRQLLSKIFNTEFSIFKDKYNFKPPGGEGFYAHYDGIFIWNDENYCKQKGWYKYTSEFFNILVSINGSNLSNGTIEVASYHRNDFDFLLSNTMQNGSPQLLKSVEDELVFESLILEPGDLVIFSHRSPHRSKKNQSDQARRILYFTYNKSVDGDYYSQYFSDKAVSNPGSTISKALSSAVEE